MTTHLLDANVLIALTVEEHEHHARVRDWISSVETIALCPVTEGALVRFLVRAGEGVAVAVEVLRLLHAHPRCEFWSAHVSYADADLARVFGHRQVTDAYLAALVAAHPHAQLATLDAGLAQLRPGLAVLIS